MSKLTTHVLDLVNGCPGRGVKIDLYRLDCDESSDQLSATRTRVASDSTNDDGRCDRPLLEGDAFARGLYEIIFHAGDYFGSGGDAMDELKFLDQVVIRFGISDPEQHYHVPLLLSRYGYSTYRGS